MGAAIVVVIDKMGWYEVELFTPWAEVILTDEEGHQTVTNFVNGSRLAGAIAFYSLTRGTDISHQASENIIPTPPLCEIWGVALGSVVLALQADPTLLVTKVAVTERPGWIVDAKEKSLPIDKEDAEPTPIDATEAMDKPKKDKVKAWMTRSAVPLATSDVDKAATWGAAIAPIKAYVRQLRKAR